MQQRLLQGIGAGLGETTVDDDDQCDRYRRGGADGLQARGERQAAERRRLLLIQQYRDRITVGRAPQRREHLSRGRDRSAGGQRSKGVQHPAHELLRVACRADDADPGQAGRRRWMATFHDQGPPLLHSAGRHLRLCQRHQVQRGAVFYEERIGDEGQSGIGRSQALQITVLAGVVDGRETAGGPAGRRSEGRGELSYKRLRIAAGTGITRCTEHQ